METSQLMRFITSVKFAHYINVIHVITSPNLCTLSFHDLDMHQQIAILLHSGDYLPGAENPFVFKVRGTDFFH